MPTDLPLLIKLPSDFFASPERHQFLLPEAVFFVDFLRCDFLEGNGIPSNLLRGERALVERSAIRTDKSFELIQSSKGLQNVSHER